MRLLTPLIGLLIVAALRADEPSFPKFKTQEIATDLTVGYAVITADINEDGKPDDGFLHVINVGDDKPMVLLFIGNRDWSAYQLSSLRVGTRQMFAVKQTAGSEKLAMLRST